MNRAKGLRLSLLASLGLVPLACGGAFKDSHDEIDTGRGGAGTSGSKGPGKQLPPIAGAAGRGVYTGGTTGMGGATNIGGTFAPGGGAPGVPGGGCRSPKYDAHTGLEACEQGYQHRPKALACGAPPSRVPGGFGGDDNSAGGVPPALPRADGTDSCNDGGAAGEENNCQRFELGFCDMQQGFGGGSSVCYSGCVTDADCGTGFICLCDNATSPTGGQCHPSRCKTDAECLPGYLCASDGYSYHFLACQNPRDICITDADCAEGYCAYDAFKDQRVCETAVPGRPFLVAQQARVAPTVARRDWCTQGALPATLHLTPGERAALASHWTRAGQMEHASIAAFARFSLQLLSLGAPSELVEACNRALADETAHAQLCFGLATAYAGRAIGPGPLDISGSLQATSLTEIVDLVLVEGCFGETGAALEALEAADSATDPVVVAAYSQIASDEQRHAELAFRFVRWALERDRVTVEERIVAALATGANASRAVVSVVAPCLEALARTRGAHAPQGGATGVAVQPGRTS